MIKRIISNGMYWTPITLLMTILTYMSDSTISSNRTIHELSMLFVIVAFSMIFTLDIIVLKRKKFVYMSGTEIGITVLSIIIFLINIVYTPVTVLLLILTSSVHYSYRLANYIEIEKLELASKYEDIRKILNLTTDCIAVKGGITDYITYIRSKEISFDTEYSLLYKKKRIKFDIIKQMQIDFNKNFIDFDDDELKVAEMYSIQ